MRTSNFSLPRHTFQCGDDVAGIFVFMKLKKLPNLGRLHECFLLDESSPSGLLWKIRPKEHFPTSKGWNIFNAKYAGKPAGSIRTDARRGKSYWLVGIVGIIYYAHRIVFSLQNNVELSVDIQVDHEDGNSLNNLPNNLRLATHSENRQNTKTQKNNTSGVKGVNWSNIHNAWLGRVGHNGKRYCLGTSPCKETMEKIVREFREKLHKEFTNHGNV